MKTAKQRVEESNWSDELKKLFWDKADEPSVQGEYLNLEQAVCGAFPWRYTPEGVQFWADVANGKRTDIDRPENTDQEYETLVRTLLQGLKGKEVGIGILDDDFTRGFNTGIREMNEKIDEAIKKLENRFDY